MNTKVDLNNTELGYSAYDDNSLKHSYQLFKLMGFSTLTKVGTVFIQLAIKCGLPIQGLIRKTLFKQFCGGDTLEKCLPIVRHLNRFKVQSILDFALEASRDEKSIALFCEEFEKSLIFIKENNLTVPFVVFKPSAICDEKVLKNPKAYPKEWLKTKEIAFKLCQKACDHQLKVLIDAEQSWFTEAIDSLSVELMQKFNSESAKIYITLQMYRRDRLDYLKQLIKNSDFCLGIKLVRGAYLEAEALYASLNNQKNPIWDSKTETDDAFNFALVLIFENIEKKCSLFIGSHNQPSTEYAIKKMQEKNISASDTRVYFSQLYGMSEPLSYNLALSDYNVCKYIPYGPVPSTVPYLLRRAKENSAIWDQSKRELSQIKSELIRRSKTQWH